MHGVRHEGKTVHPCYVGGSRFSKGHLDLLELLQPGHQYRVRYNPRRHEDSTLSASFQFGSIFPLLMGIELILFAAALMAQFGAGSTLGRPLFILCGFNLVLMLVVLLMGRGFTLSGITRIPG